MSIRARSRGILVDWICRNRELAAAVAHQEGPAPLFGLWQVAGHWTVDPAEMLRALFGMDEHAAVSLIDEARPIVESITSRQSTTAYPDFYAVELGSALVLHAIVRTQRPEVMIETGVADGLSTAVILAAMDTNGCGELHSYDVAEDVGAFVTDRSRWTLHIRKPLPSGPIDLFFHDSDHSYSHQSAEYAAAWSALRPGGLLLSDDVEWSCAFLDFAQGRDATMLLDRRKVFGALRR